MNLRIAITWDALYVSFFLDVHTRVVRASTLRVVQKGAAGAKARNR